MMTANLQDALRTACAAVGIVPRDVPADNRWHDTDVDGDPRGQGDGRIKLFPDGQGGHVCNWKGETQTFFVDDGRQLTDTERRERDRKRQESIRRAQEEEARQRADARDKAMAILRAATGDPAAHPYAKLKGVNLGPLVKRGAWPQRGWSDALLIPMCDAQGAVQTIEAINGTPDANGKYAKDFLSGGLKRGCFHPLGKIRGATRVVIAEGLTNAAVCVEATDPPAVAAMDAGNLLHVAETVRKLAAPDAELIFVADNDVRDDGTPNTGVEAANKAAAAVGGRVVVPELDGRKCDAWDLWSERGAEAVAQAIRKARPADVSEGQQRALGATAVDLVRADTIKPEAIRWIWDGWLAAGKFHILAGQPGTGKTTLALAFVATITTGGRWPDGTRATPRNVLIWSGEDDPKDTLVPRLCAMGADMSRVYFVGDVRDGVGARSFDPARDMPVLMRKAEAIGDIGLLVVDPVVSAVSGDSHKNAETRRALQPLVDLVLKLDCAALGISHFTKGTAGREPLERVTGSLAFGALARVVMVAAKVQAEPDDKAPGRILARAKSNIGPDTGGYGYDLENTELSAFPGIQASRVLWRKSIDGTAREILSHADIEDDGTANERRRPGRDDAIRWLRALLTDGPRGTTEIQQEALAAGFSIPTIRRAKDKLPIETYKEGFGKGGYWAWRLKDAHISQHPGTDEQHSQNPHGDLLPAKALTEHLNAKVLKGRPQKCEKCSFVKRAGVHECLACGFVPAPPNEVVHEAGELDAKALTANAAKVLTEHLSQNPHAAELLAKTLKSHGMVRASEQVKQIDMPAIMEAEV